MNSRTTTHRSRDYEFQRGALRGTQLDAARIAPAAHRGGLTARAPRSKRIASVRIVFERDAPHRLGGRRSSCSRWSCSRWRAARRARGARLAGLGADRARRTQASALAHFLRVGAARAEVLAGLLPLAALALLAWGGARSSRFGWIGQHLARRWCCRRPSANTPCPVAIRCWWISPRLLAEHAAQRAPLPRMHYADLREFIARLEALGELKRVAPRCRRASR